MASPAKHAGRLAGQPGSGTSRNTRSARPRRWPPVWLAAVITAVVVSVGCAACSSPNSSSDPGSTAGTTADQQGLAYAQCMRSHGVPNYPDPLGNGTFSGSALNDLGVSQSTLQAAEDACSRLQPKSPLPNEPVEDLYKEDLKFAACMRSHGEPDFPDPTVTGQSIGWTFPFSQTQTSRYQSARNSCRRYLAGGGMA
jgi:hypothetical protein